MNKDRMNKGNEEMRDDEIRIIGRTSSAHQPGQEKKFPWVAVVVFLVAIIVLVVFLLLNVGKGKSADLTEGSVEGFYEQLDEQKAVLPIEEKGYVDIEDITLSGVPMRIYTPINAIPSLALGPQDLNDPSIIFIAHSADVRSDNRDILGDFVLNGEKLARGHSKWGWCSIIDGEINIGCEKEPDALQESIDKKGFFFRQYGLVVDGKYVKDSNSKKYEAIRRAICKKGDKVFVIETLKPMSLMLFAYALEEYKVDAAVTLVGSDAYGFAKDKDGEKIEFGVYNPERVLETSSYIIWR